MFEDNVNFGIRLLSQSSLNLYGFSHAASVVCPDTWRSVPCYCMFLDPNCISWHEKKQPTLARSSAETEYRSITVAASEPAWIVSLLHDVNVFIKILILYSMIILMRYISPQPHCTCSHQAYINWISFRFKEGCVWYSSYEIHSCHRSTSWLVKKTLAKSIFMFFGASLASQLVHPPLDMEY